VTLYAYIVISLDSGPIHLTNGDPHVFNFRGEDKAFTNELVSYSLPSRSIDVFSDSLKSESMSVSFFSDKLSPGSRLSSSNRVQKSTVECVIYDEVNSFLVFEGNVSSFSYDVSTGVASIKASTSQVNSLLDFPPGSLLQEDRFVNRKTLGRDDLDGPPADTQSVSYADGIQYLVPTIEFETEFGTPSDPNQGYEFALSEIQINSSVSSFPEGSYLHFDDNTSDLAIPVVYGKNKNVAATVLGHYRVNDTALTSYFKVFILIIAGHRVVGDPDMVPQSGCDFALTLMLDSYDLTDTEDLGGNQHFLKCHYGIDRFGQEFSYATFAVEYYDVSSGDNYEQSSQPSSFDIYQCHIPVLHGKNAFGDGAIAGLGNVVRDMWLNYTELGLSTVDSDAVDTGTPDLNAYSIDAVFNDHSPGQSIVSVLSRRIQGQFPIIFSFSSGMLSWKSSELIPDQEPSARIIYGVNAYSRGKVSETDYNSVVNNVSVSYGVNGQSGGMSKSVTVNKSNNRIAKRSALNWGESFQQKVQISDTYDDSTIQRIADNIVYENGGVRFLVSYESDFMPLFFLPMLSIVLVKDDDAGFDDEKFYFTGAKWNNDLTGFTISLLSVKMI
jgi:hypothetical protein